MYLQDRLYVRNYTTTKHILKPIHAPFTSQNSIKLQNSMSKIRKYYSEERYLAVLGKQLSISAENATSVVQATSRTFWNGTTDDGNFQETREFREHGGGRRSIGTGVNILSVDRETVIGIRTVPNFLTKQVALTLRIGT